MTSADSAESQMDFIGGTNLERIIDMDAVWVQHSNATQMRPNKTLQHSARQQKPSLFTML